MEKYYTLLAQLPLFENINPEDLPAMINCLQMRLQSYRKNDFIRSEGDSADFIGIVLDGKIQILQDDYLGNRSIIASFGIGSMFAEAFCCSNTPTLPVSILAVTDCEILFLDTNNILSQNHNSCRFHNTLIRNLLRIVAQKNMLLNQKLQCMSHKTTAEKLLSYLNEQAKQQHSNEFTIPFNRQALADYLGVERSAMSAEISKLQKQGIIETRKSWFKLK